MNGQKRKPDFQQDSHFKDEHPHKKQRPGNGSSYSEGHSQVSSTTKLLPSPLPSIPDILPEFEKAVFTHSSIATQKPAEKKMVNYERLEFLGDTYLELMASEVIFERYTSAAPGKMSYLRELLCRNDVWADYSQAYKIDKKLNHAIGDDIRVDRTKIAADVFEAYVAAVILSAKDRHHGYDIAKAWVTQLWEPKLAKWGMAVTTVDVTSKEELAKMILVPGVKLNYKEYQSAIIDKHHGKSTYFMGVYLKGWGYEDLQLGTGTGESKNAASQSAAKRASCHPKLNEIRATRATYLEEREKAKAAEVAKKSP